MASKALAAFLVGDGQLVPLGLGGLDGKESGGRQPHTVFNHVAHDGRACDSLGLVCWAEDVDGFTST